MHIRDHRKQSHAHFGPFLPNGTIILLLFQAAIYSSQAKSSVSLSAQSLLGYSGSISVDIKAFNEQVPHDASFGSFEYRVNSGSTIVKTGQGHYRIENNDPRSPIPTRHISLSNITTALDPRLWTQLPESDLTYTSLRIDAKLRNFQRALNEYPIWSRAPASVGTLQCLSKCM